jgi:hypothetical protein
MNKIVASNHSNYILYKKDSRYLLKVLCGGVGMYTIDWFLTAKKMRAL